MWLAMISDSKKIVGFLSALSVVGVLIFYTSQSFFHFAFFSILWAFLFPFWFGELPKREVDYWYYLIGILGVLSFYETQKVSEDEYVTKAVLAEARERMIWLTELDTNTERFLERPEIREYVYDEFRRIFYSKSNPLNVENSDCLTAEMQESTYCVEVTRLEQLAGLLAKVGVARGSMRASIIDVGKLLGDWSIELGNEDKNILLRNIRLPAIGLYKFYRRSRSGARGGVEHLSSDIEGIMLIEQEWLEEYEKRVEALDDYGRLKWGSVIFSNLWPFFICAALCLKLSRTRFTLQRSR